MLEIETKGDTTVLRLAHGKVNALDVELLRAIELQLGDLASSDIGALVVTGAGRAFSAGVDLFRVLDGGPAYVDELIPALGAAFCALFQFPKPVVAAVQGAAIAGGCVLACACDRRVVADGAPIGASELSVGVAFPTSALEILRYACGDQAERVILSGALFQGKDASVVHLADELVPADAVLDRALEVAAGLATLASDAYQLAKEQLRRPTVDRIRAGAALDDAARDVWASPATAAAIRASLGRTTGRGGGGA